MKIIRLFLDVCGIITCLTMLGVSIWILPILAIEEARDC